ncbi:hypothetical protein OK074_8100 [Actinobacteria bacterium OK074]|nr:hypothetical protein OK074_8100 [Actinobacteria bacterium OK074]
MNTAKGTGTAVRIRRTRKVVLAVGAQLVVVACETAVQLAPADGGTWSARLFALAPAPFCLYVVWRLHLNPYVAFGQDRVRVNNVFAQYLIPYYLITALQGRTALTIDVSGHGSVPVYAFDAALTNRAQRDAVAGELLSRRDAAVPRAGHGFEKRSTTGLPEWLGPGLALALFAVAGLLAGRG